MPTNEPATATSIAHPRPTARILQFKQALRDRTAAVGGWASGRADAVRSTVARRPFATAGVSAGAAFIGGISVGLLVGLRLASRGGHRRRGGLNAEALMARAAPLTSRARSLLRK